jgi:prevent-host-death family protein
MTTTTTSYSIAEARDQFAALIRQAETGRMPVAITRRGKPVAVILSQEAYGALAARPPQKNFWTAYLEWREKWGVDNWEDDDDPFANLRDPSPGREVAVLG